MKQPSNTNSKIKTGIESDVASDIYDSPIGDIQILIKDGKLVFLDFADNPDRIDKLMKRRFGDSFEEGYLTRITPNAGGVRDRLDRYFEKDWQAFAGLEFDTGGTVFQQTVWRALTAIPMGQSISYDRLASDICNPKAVRAAASANANNPIAIVVPCHRVIGKNGAMRGYAGGIERKVWLLKHEGALI